MQPLATQKTARRSESACIAPMSACPFERMRNLKIEYAPCKLELYPASSVNILYLNWEFPLLPYGVRFAPWKRLPVILQLAQAKVKNRSLMKAADVDSISNVFRLVSHTVIIYFGKCCTITWSGRKGDRVISQRQQMEITRQWRPCLGFLFEDRELNNFDKTIYTDLYKRGCLAIAHLGSRFNSRPSPRPDCAFSPFCYFVFFVIYFVF